MGILFGLLFGSLFALLLLGLTTLSVLSLSLLVENNVLRVVIFGLGWFPLSPLTGFALSILPMSVVEIAGGQGEPVAEFLTQAALVVYPIVAFLTHRYFKNLPEEEVETWRQALRSGALFGFGVGTGGRLLKTGGGFGGFGGGSFGGGGAGGAFKGASLSGAQGTAGSGAAAGGASAAAQGAAAGAVGTAGGGEAEEPTSSSADDANGGTPPPGPDVAEPAVSKSRDDESSAPAEESRSGRWWSRFEGRHVIGFFVVALAFVPLGVLAAYVLPTKVGIALLAIGAVALVFRVTNPWSTASGSAFRGGEAADSWS